MSQGICSECDHVARGWKCRRKAKRNWITGEWGEVGMKECADLNDNGQCKEFFDKRRAQRMRDAQSV